MSIFKKGDYLKPSKNSRFNAEHWRYLVIRVGKNGIDALETGHNVYRIEYPPYDDSDFELATDGDAEEIADAKNGKFDYRFKHWDPLD